MLVPLSSVSGVSFPNTSWALAHAAAVRSLTCFINPIASKLLPLGLEKYPMSYNKHKHTTI